MCSVFQFIFIASDNTLAHQFCAIFLLISNLKEILCEGLLKSKISLFLVFTVYNGFGFLFVLLHFRLSQSVNNTLSIFIDWRNSVDASTKLSCFLDSILLDFANADVSEVSRTQNFMKLILENDIAPLSQIWA